jgi:guanine deaminase
MTRGRSRSGASGQLAAAAVRGALLTPLPDGEVRYLPDGLLVIDREGRILHAGKPERRWAKAPLIGGSPDAMIAAPFWDAHIHLPQLPLAGLHAEPLLEWLRIRVFPEEARHADGAYARSATVAFYDALAAAGTAGAGVFTAPFPEAGRLALEEAAERRVPVRAGPPWMDGGPPQLRRSAEDWEAELHALRGRYRCRAAVVPRFALSCSPPMLARAGRLRRAMRAWVLGHISETEEEVAAVRQRFREAGKEAYARLYDQHRLLGPRTILAHGVHLSEGEMALLSQRRAVIAHCPTANRALGSGRMPLERLRRHGVRWCLASDVGAGTDPCLLDAMQGFLDVHRGRAATGAAEAYFRASWAGADALGFGRHRGALVEGRWADFLLVEPRPRRVRGAEGAVRAWLERGQGRPWAEVAGSLALAGRFLEQVSPAPS